MSIAVEASVLLMMEQKRGVHRIVLAEASGRSCKSQKKQGVKADFAWISQAACPTSWLSPECGGLTLEGGFQE